MPMCKKCKRITCGNAGFSTHITECGVYIPPKPITNYDLLIRKTPEEMAEWLYNVPAAWYAKKEAWLDWLKQEAENN